MKKTMMLSIMLALTGMQSFANEAALPSALSLVSVNGKEILATRNGLTAYVFDVDGPGKSNCYNGCAHAWPAILVTDGEQLVSPFGIATRTDGSKQITFNNHPIYTYFGDGKSGDTNGDGLGGVWHIISQ